MQEDFTQNGLHPGISMCFETCEVRVRLFKCVSPGNERFRTAAGDPLGFFGPRASEVLWIER